MSTHLSNPFADETPNAGTAAWGGTSVSGAKPTNGGGGVAEEVERPAGEIVRETILKDKAIRDIMDLQKSLRAIMHSITSTEKESDRLQAENETLGLYLENMSKSASVAANSKTNSGIGRR